MKRRHCLITLLPPLLAPLLALPGCAQHYYGEHNSAVSQTLPSNQAAADALWSYLQQLSTQRVLVATLVSLDRLQESSRFGRLVSEQIAGRLVQIGVPVVEVRLREQLQLHPDQGALLLSRQLKEVSASQQARLVVLGTYAVANSVVYISLKVVQPEGNAVIAAHDYSLPIDQEIRRLLAAQ